jgi:hypothetical protein
VIVPTITQLQKKGYFQSSPFFMTSPKVTPFDTFWLRQNTQGDVVMNRLSRQFEWFSRHISGVEIVSRTLVLIWLLDKIYNYKNLRFHSCKSLEVTLFFGSSVRPFDTFWLSQNTQGDVFNTH